MKILLVNDDGYLTDGIVEVEKVLKNYGDIYVVAPNVSMSGMGTAVSVCKPIKVNKIDDHHYYLVGTPSDCTEFGLLMLNVDFDVVIAGINNGLNIAGDVLHSGTVGACLESLSYGVPAIALSHDKNLELSLNYIDKVMNFILNNNLLNENYVINVNFPNSLDQIKIKIAKNIQRKDKRWFDIKNDCVIANRSVDDHENYDKNSEIYLIKHNFITISFLQKNFANIDLYNKFKKLTD